MVTQETDGFFAVGSRAFGGSIQIEDVLLGSAFGVILLCSLAGFGQYFFRKVQYFLPDCFDQIVFRLDFQIGNELVFVGRCSLLLYAFGVFGLYVFHQYIILLVGFLNGSTGFDEVSSRVCHPECQLNYR